jgi:hypothetical protein
LTIVIPKDAAEFKELLELFINADHPDKRISLVTDTPYQGFDVPESLARHVGVLPAQDAAPAQAPPAPPAAADAGAPQEPEPQDGTGDDEGPEDSEDETADETEDAGGDAGADEDSADEQDTGTAGPGPDKPAGAKAGTRAKKTSPAGGAKRKETP